METTAKIWFCAKAIRIYPHRQNKTQRHIGLARIAHFTMPHTLAAIHIMSRINSYFFLFLFVISLQSCFSSKNANRNRMVVSLNQTKWLVKNAIDSGKVDTIEFSFGFYNTGGKLDLISYSSKTTKELSEFNIVKDTIIFESYSIAPPSIEIDFAHCKTKSILIFANNKMRYSSLVSYCGEKEKENISQPSTIEITKL